MIWPRLTGWPARTSADARNEYEVRIPPACATTTWSAPATSPAKDTVPSLEARTAVPAAAAKSTPRWPAAYWAMGATKGRTTAPLTGGIHSPEVVWAATSRSTTEIATSVTATNARTTRAARGAPNGRIAPPRAHGWAGEGARKQALRWRRGG